ncbi:MAG: FHA domain-containing protein, partial [Betaproteobacteria bacterium]|nr:FHA domain-containing protein [Betaproteobacteria bacterium]
MLRIVVTDSKGAKSEHTARGSSASIGKADDNTVVLRGWTVGKRQATLELRGESIYIVDHGGLSATELNGKAFEGERGPLAPSDVIGIAGYGISVSKAVSNEEAPSPAAAPVPAPAVAVKAAAMPVADAGPRPVVDAHSQTTTLDLRAAIAGLPSMEAPPPPKPAPIAAPAPAVSAPAAAPIKPVPAPVSNEYADVMTKWRTTIYEKLISTMDLRRVDVSRMNEDQLRTATAAIVNEIIAAESDIPTVIDKARLGKEVLDEAVGLGPLEELLADPAVTEIMVNRYDQIYIERGGKLTQSPVVFTGEKGVVSAIERIV